MRSTLTWVDVSERQQRRMIQLLNNWAERGILDELGIGTIRDAFSEYFFPGTSTIQTRARYMLFVPWMYRDLQNRRVPSREIADRAREYEVRIISSLREKCPDEEGIIGVQAGASLRQLPSSIYWNGLGTWEIRRFQGVQRAYQQFLDRYYRKLDELDDTDSEMERVATRPHNWHPQLPEPPETWPQPQTLQLRPSEAVFLRDRIMEEHPGSLLARLIGGGVRERDIDRFWELQHIIQSLSGDLQDEVVRARSFAELIQGADLVYYLVLAQGRDDGDLVGRYRSLLRKWCERNEKLGQEHERYRNSADWLSVQEGRPSRAALGFERRWRQLLLGLDDFTDLADNGEAKKMIRQREVRVKGSRARVHGGRRLERWNPPNSATTLDFRWTVVRNIIADIVDGLEGAQNA